MDAKQRAEELLNSVLPFAEKMLKEHGEFYPYGEYISQQGEFVSVGAKVDGTDHPPSHRLIEILRSGLQQDASAGKCEATALVFDVRIRLPKTGTQSDAIQVCLDHKSGHSVEVLFPYQFVNGDLKFGETFAQKGENLIFPRT